MCLLVDLVVEVEKKTSADEVNAKLKEASEGALKGYLGYSEAPLVSIDFNGCPNSSTVDAPNTYMIDDTLVKVLSWYDNEWGFSNRMVDLALKLAK